MLVLTLLAARQLGKIIFSLKVEVCNEAVNRHATANEAITKGAAKAGTARAESDVSARTGVAAGQIDLATSAS